MHSQIQSLIANYACGFGRIWRRFRRQNRGVAMLEMALVLPVLLLLGLGGLELGMLILSHSRINQVGFAVADNASRIGAATGDVREIDINEVFTGASLQLEGLPFQQKGRIILSSLERKDNNSQWIRWQRCYGSNSYASSYGNQSQDLGSQGMGPAGRKVQALKDSAVMFVEIVYDHEPLFMRQLFGTRQFHSTFAFNVREARNLDASDGKGIIPTDGVAAKTC